MCGIIGIAGPEGSDVVPMLVQGLKRLEYRGYDSVGIAVVSDGRIVVRKGAGKIDEVARVKGFPELHGSVGVGHTRWATHGRPSDENAHPHLDCRGRIAVVHNGIIRNYSELRERLEARGHVFASETDTEIIAHLVEDELRGSESFMEAFRRALARLEGSFAVALLYAAEPRRIFFARMESPLVLGLSSNTNYLASDIPAFLDYTDRVIVLRDGEMGWITSSQVYIEDWRSGRSVEASGRLRRIPWTAEMAAKSGYPHFMLKEIYEQPAALRNSFRGLAGDESLLKAAEIMASADRIFVAAAGTSFHAGLFFDHVLGRLAGRIAYTLVSSEYHRLEGVVRRGDVLLAISQSGETIDTLKAARLALSRGARVVALSNVIDSAIPRESSIAIYTRAGPEIGVAATKTFLTQVLALTMLAARIGVASGRLDEGGAKNIYQALFKASSLVRRTITATEGVVRELANWLAGKHSAYMLSRGIGVPLSMEAALKVKEIAYIHAEAYPAGESKHGPIALVENGFPVFILSEPGLEEELEGNAAEMKARGAKVIVVSGTSKPSRHLDLQIRVPEAEEFMTPYTHIPPMQLLAYYTAIKLGYDPDKPRNLAKTVTVE